jgi:hypothetical protein
MSDANPYSRATILAGATVKRLQREGCSLKEAKRLVVAVINSEEAEMNRQRRPFDAAGTAERLNRLPEFLP